MVKYGMDHLQNFIRKMNYLIKDLLETLSFEFNLIEHSKVKVDKISLIHYASPGCVCYLDKNLPDIVRNLTDVLLICPYDFDESNKNISYLKTSNPKLVFYYISHLFGNNSQFKIDEVLSAKYPGSFIGENCTIGENTNIQPGVIIRSNTKIGNNVTIESGSVIGSTGLLWVWDNRINQKIMLCLTGGTIIGDDSYICSNVSIVRGACNEDTILGESVMIAPGSAIGHGSIIGDFTHIANNVTISGAVKIGKKCFLGSGCTIQPAVKLGDSVVIGSGAVLNTGAKSDGVYVGIPAKWIKDKSESNLKGLPND